MAPFHKLLLKRLIDSEIISYIEISKGVSIRGMKSNPDFIQITRAGSDCLESLGQTEL